MPSAAKLLARHLVAYMLALSACTTTGAPSGFLTTYEGFRTGPDGGVDKI